MKEFEVTATLRNNRLKERRGEMTQEQMAAACGVSLQHYASLETLRTSPITADLVAIKRARRCIACGCEWSLRIQTRYLCGECHKSEPSPEAWSAWMEAQPKTWKKSSRRVADALGVTPEDLWPESVLAVKHTTSTLKLNGDELRALRSPSRAMAGALMGEVEAPDSTVMRRELRRDLRLALTSLTPREQKVMTLRFGLQDKTLDECAADVGVNRERVRQIEARALRKLRHPSRSDRLKVHV